MIARDCVLSPENSIDLEPGAATLIDLSRYKNNGSIDNGAAWTQLPSGLWVLSFDGSNDRVTWGDIGNLTHMTTVGWFCPTSPANYEVLFQLRKVGVEHRWAVRIVVNGSISGYNLAGAAFGVGGVGVVQAGVWIMVAFSSDASDTYMDLDGGRLTGALGSGNTTPTDMYAYLATGYDLSATRSFAGLVGEFKVYNYAWSSGQIRNHYEKTKHLFGVHD